MKQQTNWPNWLFVSSLAAVPNGLQRLRRGRLAPQLVDDALLLGDLVADDGHLTSMGLDFLVGCLYDWLMIGFLYDIL